MNIEIDKIKIISIFLLRIVIGLFFVLIAINKVFNLNSFQEIILKYDILPIATISFFSLFILFLEYALGMLLILGLYIRWTVFGLLLLMFVFITAILINISRGNYVDCGCFGNLMVDKIGWQVIFRDFIIVGILLIIGKQKNIKFQQTFKKQETFLMQLQKYLKKRVNTTNNLSGSGPSKIFIYVFILSIAVFSFTMVYSIKGDKNINATPFENMVGEQLPVFSGFDPSGIKFSTQSTTTETLVLCYIDKLECTSCEETLIFLKSLYNEFNDINNLNIVVIMNGTNKYNVLRYKKLHQLKFPIIIDQSTKIRKKLKVKYAPIKMIVVNNVILFIQNYSPYTKEDNTKFRKIVSTLIR